MSLKVGKSRNAKVQGLKNAVVSEPISEWNRIQKNSDGTLTIIVDFYEDQATLDERGEPFDTISYQITEPANLSKLINKELKKLPDFDVAT